MEHDQQVGRVFVRGKMVVLFREFLGNNAGNFGEVFFLLSLIPNGAIDASAVADCVVLPLEVAVALQLAFVVGRHPGVDRDRDRFIICRERDTHNGE